MGLRVQYSRFRVQGLGFNSKGSGLQVFFYSLGLAYPEPETTKRPSSLGRPAAKNATGLPKASPKLSCSGFRAAGGLGLGFKGTPSVPQKDPS